MKAVDATLNFCNGAIEKVKDQETSLSLDIDYKTLVPGVVLC